MVEVFKTNVQTQKQAKVMLAILSTEHPALKINFDLKDCDKILRVEGQNIQIEIIVEVITKSGYQCNVLT